jgi:hypothetical protein
MNSEPRPKPVGAAAALAEACTEYAALKHAEAQILRLSQCKGLSAGMKDDLRRHKNRAGEARNALDSILTVAR